MADADVLERLVRWRNARPGRSYSIMGGGYTKKVIAVLRSGRTMVGEHKVSGTGATLAAAIAAALDRAEEAGL